MANVLRIAAAVVGGLGAIAGVMIGPTGLLLFFLGFVQMGLARGPGLGLSWVGEGAGTMVACGLGIAGAGMAIGRRLVLATWLMVAGALGTLICSVLYTALTIILVPLPDVPVDPRYPTEAQDYLGYLIPAPLPLLVGAVLALFAHGTERRTTIRNS